MFRPPPVGTYATKLHVVPTAVDKEHDILGHPGITLFPPTQREYIVLMVGGNIMPGYLPSQSLVPSRRLTKDEMTGSPKMIFVHPGAPYLW